MPVSIQLENVSVQYQVTEVSRRALGSYFMDSIRWGKRWTHPVLALRNVSVRVETSEVLGVIGHNGAGKSTLLRVMSRVIEPTGGTVHVSGVVSPIMEINTGFVPDLTGLENIYLGASLLGMSRRQIERKVDSITAFADLEEFIQAPVRIYSSGMRARLGFAIATEVDPDILLIDEVLAVGDADFRAACQERMKRFKASGITTVIVSHDMKYIEKTCDRVLWLKHGEVYRYGEAADVVREFRKAKTHR